MEKLADAKSLVNDEFSDDGVSLAYLKRHLLITEDQQGKQDYNHAPIFCSQANCKGKACNIIIDGGSALNVISKEAVEKLKLPTTKHLRPYK